MSNPMPHLFEFMDLDWLPKSLRNTLREILECGNAKPFRPYYDFAVDTIVEQAALLKANQIVELGAGTAPLTRRLAQDERCQAKLTICDANPDRAAYRDLQQRFPNKISFIDGSVDFSQQRDWPSGTLLVLSATLHHLPTAARRQSIEAMAKSADAVVIVEPLRRTVTSLLFVILSAVPALLLPLWFLGRSGTLRRMFWCWLLPLAPLMFLWDGWVSCLRQWTDAEYQQQVDLMPGIECSVNHELFTQVVVVKRSEQPE